MMLVHFLGSNGFY